VTSKQETTPKATLSFIATANRVDVTLSNKQPSQEVVIKEFTSGKQEWKQVSFYGIELGSGNRLFWRITNPKREGFEEKENTTRNI